VKAATTTASGIASRTAREHPRRGVKPAIRSVAIPLVEASSAKLTLGVPKNLERCIEWQSPWLPRRPGVEFNAPCPVFVIYLRKLFAADEHFGNETITVGRA